MPKVSTPAAKDMPSRALMLPLSSQMKSGARPVNTIGQMSALCSIAIIIFLGGKDLHSQVEEFIILDNGFKGSGFKGASGAGH